MKVKQYKVIQDYIDIIEKGREDRPITDAPMEYHIFSFLTILGTLFSDKCYFYYGAKKITPNFWTVLVGKSSLFRKSTTIDIAMKFMFKEYILPQEFSMEGLFKVLEERNKGIFYIDEFSHFFSQFHRTYMTGGTAFFLSLYEGKTIERVLSGETRKIFNPLVSVISATTFEGISSSLKEREIRTGLLPRFIFVVIQKKKNYIPLPDEIVWEKVEKLKRNIKNITPQKNISIKITPMAIGLYEKFCQEVLNKNFSYEELAFITRLQIVALKIATILAVIENRNYISDKDMETSIELTNYLIKGAQIVLNSLCYSPFQEKRKKVVDYLLEIGDWVSRSQIIRKTRLSTAELNSVLTTLEDEGILESEKRKEFDAKKPQTFYRILINGEEENEKDL